MYKDSDVAKFLNWIREMPGPIMSIAIDIISGDINIWTVVTAVANMSEDYDFVGVIAGSRDTDLETLRNVLEEARNELTANFYAWLDDRNAELAWRHHQLGDDE